MNRHKSRRMQPVIQVAESREEQAARALGEQQRAVDAQRQQLRELEAYRTEYRTQLAEAGSGGITAARLIDLRQFLANLDQAIEQQAAAVKMAEQLCQQKRQEWFTARGNTQALVKVRERYQRAEADAAQRQEQKALDEFGQRRPGKR